MQEATRRQYLALLGIDVWLPRDEAAASDAAAAVATVAAPVAPSAPEPVAERPAVVAEPAPVEQSPAMQTPVTQAPTVQAPTEQAPTGQAPVTPPSEPVSMPPPVTASPAGSLSCSLLSLPDGLLLLAGHVTPQAPGLSGPEFALLASIAGALAPGATLPAIEEFHWPPRNLRLPAAAARGHAGDALIGLLAEHRRRRHVRDVLVLGEALADSVRAAASRLGLNVVAVPAVSAMLVDPALKRACWDAAKSLRRAGN